MCPALEGDFVHYVDAIKPFILSGLAKKEEYEVCKVAVGVVGDLCRALGPNIAPHVTEFMTLLLQALAVSLLIEDARRGRLRVTGRRYGMNCVSTRWKDC